MPAQIPNTARMRLFPANPFAALFTRQTRRRLVNHIHSRVPPVPYVLLKLPSNIMPACGHGWYVMEGFPPTTQSGSAHHGSKKAWKESSLIDDSHLMCNFSSAGSHIKGARVCDVRHDVCSPCFFSFLHTLVLCQLTVHLMIRALGDVN